MNDKTINRRGFLGALAASIWALLSSGRNAMARPAKLQAVALCRCPIAGFQYHQGQALLPKLGAGQTLILQREPTNPYDPLAIALHTTAGCKLGYLPRRLNEIPATLMDNGHYLEAVIADVSRDAPPWEMVEVDVHLTV